MDPELARRVLDERRGSALREVIPSTMGEPLLWPGLDGLVDLRRARAAERHHERHVLSRRRGSAARLSRSSRPT
jgi:hypothetical protein